MAVGDIATAAVLTFVAAELTVGARRQFQSRRWRRGWEVARGLRLVDFGLAVVTVAIVIAVAWALLLIAPLRFGWWTALGGNGNPVIGSSSRLSGSILSWLVPAVFLALVVPLLPAFAEAEERRFRMGAEGWSTRRRAWRGLQFGLVHAVIGIPIGVAGALSVGGWYFTWRYVRAARRGSPEAGLLASTRAHLSYNLVVLAVVAVAVATGQV